MNEWILSFKEYSNNKHLPAGGKGSVLARLYQSGYPVPDGLIIFPDAFINDNLRPEAWVQAQARLRQLRKGNNPQAFAVRSSALLEDSAQASFAGEFETVLNVCSDDEIRDAIHSVRCSRRSGRVQAYSQAKGVDTNQEIAVVVQRMVQADLSGVLFTADPITGSRAVMMGNFAPGLGDRLVSGSVTGEAFTFERHRGRYNGPDELKRYAGSIYRLAARLERELGSPQDIEWAIAGGKLYLLQARPITTMQGYNLATGEWNHSLTGDYLWTNVNFGEAVPQVMTPLTWSAIQFILSDWVFVPGIPMVGNIGGHPYVNISVLASLFRALGKDRRDLLTALEATLYMGLPDEIEIPCLPMSPRVLISSLLNSVQVQLRQRQGVRRLDAYLKMNPDWFKQMQERIRQIRNQADLLLLWEAELEPHLKQSVWCVLGSVTHSTNYTIHIRRELTELVGTDDANLLIANLSSDQTGLLASLGPVVGLAKVSDGEMSREAYLEKYGHRGPNEFELSAPRPAEDPEWIDRELDNYRRAPVDVLALLEKQRDKFEAAWQRLQSHSPRKAGKFRRRIAESARLARLRELARSEYVRDRWLMRLFALRAGELSGLGDDIFFLTKAEVLDLLSGGGQSVGELIARRKESYQRYKSLPPYPPIIRGRFEPFQWATDAQRRRDIFDAQATQVAHGQDAANRITGSPGSAGRVEGTVRILATSEEGMQLKNGEILVAKQTDIAWTLLFPRAAAVITDVGAPLSHAAIVARELGIPAVVGCRIATQRLKTGDRVVVDGGRGVVEILKAI